MSVGGPWANMASAVERRMAAVIGKREDKGLLRKLSSRSYNGAPLVDFCSNDYLGVGRSEDLKAETAKEMEIAEAMVGSEGGCTQGSSGSRLLSGNNSYAESVENHIAKFHKKEAALLFNSGYTANMGVISSMPMQGDIVLYDSLCHNSIIEGMKLGRQKLAKSFRHNDIAHLAELVAQHKDEGGVIFVVVESVYSMEGDVGRLKDFCDVLEGVEGCLIVDEAHGTGLFGEGGRGVVSEMGLEEHPKILCSVHTYGKAYGVHGAAVVGSRVLKSYLLNYARSLIFTTSLSLHSLAAIRAAYTVIEQADGRRKHLTQLIEQFTTTLHARLPPTRLLTSPSPIQAVIIHGNQNVINAAHRLRELGYDVLPIRAPTVAAGLERLRVILHAHNTVQEVTNLTEIIEQLCTTNHKL